MNELVEELETLRHQKDRAQHEGLRWETSARFLQEQLRDAMDTIAAVREWAGERHALTRHAQGTCSGCEVLTILNKSETLESSH